MPEIELCCRYSPIEGVAWHLIRRAISPRSGSGVPVWYKSANLRAGTKTVLNTGEKLIREVTSMLIDTILKDKGGAVTTIVDTATLSDAAHLLDQKRIGAVVAVDDNGALVGVLSERDIVRRFARHGKDAVSMPVSEAMTRGIITASPHETIGTCLGRMTDRRIRHLPVVEKGELLGIISIGDLVKYKIDNVLAEAEAMQAYIKSG